MRLLTVQDMQRIISEVEYDGFELEVYEGFKEGPHFHAVGTVPDNFNKGATVTLDIHSSIPPQVSDESFLLWLSWRMTRQEIHESMEKLKVKATGEAWMSPHREGADKDVYAPKYDLQLPVKQQAKMIFDKFSALGLDSETSKKCAGITSDEISKVAVNAGYWMRVEDAAFEL